MVAYTTTAILEKSGRLHLEALPFAEGTRVEVTVRETEQPSTLQPRIEGLHRGSMVTTDDFDAPLPDEFWLGEE